MARGDPHCHIVGKPATAWDDPPEGLDLQPENIAAELDDLREELRRLRGRLPAGRQDGNLIGASAGFRAAVGVIDKAADTPITVLLLGETGVGKEMFAHRLHERSSRSGQPFVAVNCGAIPHELVEAELFGVCKGAYTGALATRAGRFERASGGTLFLDEVGDLPLAAQVKLLRVLQTGEIEPLGSEGTVRVDVRIVAATHIELQKAVAQGRFRADQYYRLAQYPVVIPPLRERRGDIALLAAALVDKHGASYRKRLRGLSDGALHSLMAHDWPGNVRELENLIERGVLLAPQGGLIETEHLFAGATPGGSGGAALGPTGTLVTPADSDQRRVFASLLQPGFDLAAHEPRLMAFALERAHGNLTQAAKLLGITRRQLTYRLKQVATD